MKSPFKFLDSYTKDDRDVFFGREREIEELYQKVFDSKLLLVYGVSGTGKSSLIHCGLANKFLETDWLPLVIRRGGNMIDSLATSIKTASVTPQENKFLNTSDFKKGVRSLYLDHYKPVFFIFDQFEELFIFGNKEERLSFIKIVKTLTESDLQCRMIFVMREEYMAWVTEFEKVIPTFFSNRVRIEKMSHINALETIKEPCKVFNISLEEGFAEALLEKLSPESTEVELTYLQVYLDKVFRLAESKGGSPANQQSDEGLSFTLALLSKTGNVSDLLGSFLDDQIALMDDPDTAMTVLKAFVSAKGTKRPATETETIENVRSLGKDISKDTITKHIQLFIKLRVLRDKDDQGRNELRHDALAEKVFEKFSLAEQELLEIKQLIENAYQHYLKRKILLNNDDLSYIDNRDSMLNLNSDLQGFMADSRQHQRASKAAIKRLVIFSGLAFLVLLITMVYTLVERSNKSKSILLAKESVIQCIRPVDKLCFAWEAWDAYPTDEAKEALFKAFNTCIRNPGEEDDLINLSKKYHKDFKPVSSPLEFADCSRDNKFIFGYSNDSVFVWTTNGGLYSGFKTGNSPLISLQMSNDGEYLGALNRDSILLVWDNSGKLKFSRQIIVNSLNYEQIFVFTKDNRILTVDETEDAELLETDGSVIQSFKRHKGKVNAVDISDDGRFIATAGSDSCVNIWYLNSNEHKYDVYNTIHFPADTIISINFAPNNKYILSTASNGTIRITNVNGELAWGVNKNYRSGNWNILSFEDLYFAEFNESGTGLVFKVEESQNGKHGYFMSALYFDIYEQIAGTGQINKFDYIKYSPDNNYLISSKDDDNLLLTWILYKQSEYDLFNNYQLLNISGRKPFFSADGKYVYSITGNHLDSWFIDIESISANALDFHNRWGKYLDTWHIEQFKI